MRKRVKKSFRCWEAATITFNISTDILMLSYCEFNNKQCVWFIRTVLYTALPHIPYLALWTPAAGVLEAPLIVSFKMIISLLTVKQLTMWWVYPTTMDVEGIICYHICWQLNLLWLNMFPENKSKLFFKFDAVFCCTYF